MVQTLHTSVFFSCLMSLIFMFYMVVTYTYKYTKSVPESQVFGLFFHLKIEIKQRSLHFKFLTPCLYYVQSLLDSSTLYYEQQFIVHRTTI